MINHDFINNLCKLHFKKDLNSLIDDLIKEHLGKKNKIKPGRLTLVNYYINHYLYDMCFKAPANIETDKVLMMIEVCSRQYILNNYVDKKEIKEEYAVF